MFAWVGNIEQGIKYEVVRLDGLVVHLRNKRCLCEVVVDGDRGSRPDRPS